MRGPHPPGALRLVITCDTVAGSGVSATLDGWVPRLRPLVDRRYGEGLMGLGAIFMCRQPELQRGFKRRLRFARKTRELLFDVMLDLDEVRALTPAARWRHMKTRLLSELTTVLDRYDVADFDRARFLRDLDEAIGEAADADRADA